MADLGFSPGVVLLLIIIALFIASILIVLIILIKEWHFTKRTKINADAATEQIKIMYDRAASSKEHLPPETETNLEKDNVLFLNEIRQERTKQIILEQKNRKSENTPPACKNPLSEYEGRTKDVVKLILNFLSNNKDEKK